MLTDFCTTHLFTSTCVHTHRLWRISKIQHQNLNVSSTTTSTSVARRTPRPNSQFVFSQLSQHRCTPTRYDLSGTTHTASSEWYTTRLSSDDSGCISLHQARTPNNIHQNNNQPGCFCWQMVQQHQLAAFASLELKPEPFTNRYQQLWLVRRISQRFIALNSPVGFSSSTANGGLQNGPSRYRRCRVWYRIDTVMILPAAHSESDKTERWQRVCWDRNIHSM